MTFDRATYENMVSERSEAQWRVFPQYRGLSNDFDIAIVGSGVGGGMLADDVADRSGRSKRILVIEAGSFLVPTHVYNLSRIPNTALAPRFACKTFTQNGDGSSQNYIHERLQLNFGGRSIFWSGLIPHLQGWELDFFPPRVRSALAARFLDEASRNMNESVTLGKTAKRIVDKLRESELAADFDIVETPRALHQPYLNADGTPREQFFIESTGVFNTAELLVNQVGPTGANDEGPGLYILLNHYLEDVRVIAADRIELVVRNVLDGSARFFKASKAVLAAGSLESPKLLRRSTLFPALGGAVQAKVGVGLTDHPTTDAVQGLVTNIGEVPIPKDSSAKIIFYSRGLRTAANEIRFPFNVEMNVNHEYWHLRENDANAPLQPIASAGSSIIDIKFSFGNCLDDVNHVKPAPPFGYVPEVVFRNQNWLDHLAGSRFPAVAGWNKTFPQIFAVLNDITFRIFRQFQNFGGDVRPRNLDWEENWYGEKEMDFGWGTVHHAVGTLRMPYRTSYTGATRFDSVVDEDLRVIGTQNLYVCDMSVLPFASAANPVRTLAGLALRLSEHLA